MKGAARSHRQAGAVLAFLLLLFVPLFGIAALTLDLGLARVTQASQQNAVDPAALEALLGRDMPLGLSEAVREQRRRNAARSAVLRTVDEDGVDLPGLADGSAPNLTITGLGLGPEIDIAGGGGVAGGQIVGGGPSLPDPQLNLDNEVFGDVVVGDWVGTALCDPSVPPELSDYLRCDFAPALVADATAHQAANSALARTRRTSDPLGLDAIGGVSSTGAPLPYIWARGAFLDVGAASPLQNGITVRATAIADARPAVVAGVPAGGRPGLTEVAVDLDDDDVADTSGWLGLSVEAWQTCLPVGTPVDTIFDPLGVVSLNGCAAVGAVLTPGGTPGLLAMGEPALPAGEGLALVGASQPALVALYDDVLGTPRVVGFGAVLVTPGALATEFALTRLAGPAGDGFLPGAGVSAVVVPDQHPVMDAATWSAVLTANAALLTPARAPVLVR